MSMNDDVARIIANGDNGEFQIYVDNLVAEAERKEKIRVVTLQDLEMKPPDELVQTIEESNREAWEMDAFRNGMNSGDWMNYTDYNIGQDDQLPRWVRVLLKSALLVMTTTIITVGTLAFIDFISQNSVDFSDDRISVED